VHLVGFAVEACVIFEVTVNNHKSQSLQLLKRETWCANLCPQVSQLSLYAKTQHGYAVRPGDNAAQHVAFCAVSIKHFYEIQRRTAANVYRYCSTENETFTVRLSRSSRASTTLHCLTLSCDVWRRVVEWGVPDVSMEHIKLSLLGGLNTAAPLWEPQKSQTQRTSFVLISISILARDDIKHCNISNSTILNKPDTFPSMKPYV